MDPIYFYIIIGIILLVAFGATVLVIIGLRDAKRSSDPLQERLEEFASRGETVTLEEIELSQPFSERVVLPVARRFGDIAMRFTPQNAIVNISRRIELAGNPPGLEPTIFFASRFIIAAFLGGGLALVFILSDVSWPLFRVLLIIVLFTLLGYLMPSLMLKSRIDRRQKNIRKAMPDALDLLTICVEAGLGFDGAMSKVNEKWDNELALAFGRVLREIQLGKLRRDAMRDMADRLGIPEMTSFVAAIIQSEQLGVSMAKVLRIQADRMRVKRRQLAEEEAHKAPVKMLIPMGLLIFPSILIILLGPAALMLMQSALAQFF